MAEKKSKRANLNERASFLSTLYLLKDFCQDNVLALKPILEEMGSSGYIEERISKFMVLSEILDLIEQHILAEEEEEEKEAKNQANAQTPSTQAHLDEAFQAPFLKDSPEKKKKKKKKKQ